MSETKTNTVDEQVIKREDAQQGDETEHRVVDDVEGDIPPGKPDPPRARALVG